MVIVQSLLQTYEDFDRQGEELADSTALREVAEWLVGELPAGELTLLGRTDSALMVCAACSLLRSPAATRVERAPFGRTGWTPPPDAVLVEPVPPNPGLLDTINNRWPTLDVLVAPRDVRDQTTQPVAA
jgi:hypothetical protein